MVTAEVRKCVNILSPQTTDCHDNDALDIAFSGAVATVAHVDGIHVHVACCGDVQAVVGCLEVIHVDMNYFLVRCSIRYIPRYLPSRIYALCCK